MTATTTRCWTWNAIHKPAPSAAAALSCRFLPRLVVPNLPSQAALDSSRRRLPRRLLSPRSSPFSGRCGQKPFRLWRSLSRSRLRVDRVAATPRRGSYTLQFDVKCGNAGALDCTGRGRCRVGADSSHTLYCIARSRYGGYCSAFRWKTRYSCTAAVQ